MTFHTSAQVSGLVRLFFEINILLSAAKQVSLFCVCVYLPLFLRSQAEEGNIEYKVSKRAAKPFLPCLIELSDI